MKNIHGEILFQFIKILEMTDMAKILWLENETLDNETEHLEYTFDENPKEEILRMSWNEVNIQDIVETIREQGCMKDLEMTPLIAWQNEHTVKITWEIRKDHYYVPIYMQIRKRELAEAFPEEKEYQIVEEDTPIKLLHLPVEYIAVEHMTAILKNLELIGDMGHYLDLYEELGREAFSGRKMQVILNEELRRQGIVLDRKRIELFKSYKTYTYMKKRFKSYVRRKSDVDWEEAFKRISEFLVPMMDAIVEQQIFFGDWMPEICRYLD